MGMGWGEGTGVARKNDRHRFSKKDQPGLQEEELLQNLVNDDN